MKEPLDELLVQACAAQQRADLAALEQLEPANVPMPFVPQVRRTPRRLLKTVIIAAVCAVLATTAYAFWPRVAVILEGSRAYLAVQEAPQTDIPMEQMQLTWLPDGCTVTWDDSTYQEYGAYSCLIDNGRAKNTRCWALPKCRWKTKSTFRAAGRMMQSQRKMKKTLHSSSCLWMILQL